MQGLPITAEARPRSSQHAKKATVIGKDAAPNVTQYYIFWKKVILNLTQNVSLIMFLKF